MFYGGEILNGTYQVIENIGKGGTGVIYKAYHMRLKKYVVVKLLDGAKISREKLRVEVDILKRLRHMYLPQVYDFLEVGNQVYTVMDYIEGKDLEHYLKEGYVFRESVLILWLKQLCQVLDYLHSQKPPVYHSDIKPANIMITPEGNVCLIDFNISLGSGYQAGILGLSQWYAAPEQYAKAELFTSHQDSSGIQLDGRMDIYSLGASFYTLMTKRLPERSREKFIPLSRFRLPYSSAFINIVEKAMEERPRKRYRSAADMGKALDFMYKMDSGYRMLNRTGWLIWALCGGIFVSGVLSGIYGWQEMGRESYRKDYSAFYRSAQRYEDQDTLSMGIEILNDGRYRGILEANPEDKAEILYVIGNVYYGMEDYASAEEYYQEAGEEKGSPVYYRDQALAAARQGKISQAQRIIQKAEEDGLEDKELLLAKQEIAFEQEDMETVRELALSLENSGDKEIAAYSCILAAKAYGSLQDYDSQAAYLEKAYSLGSDKRCLRELGSAYLEAAGKAGLSSEKLYLRRALECYQRLEKSYAVSYRDQMNLAVIWEELGEYAQAQSQLEDLEEKYPEDYQIPMHMAYVLLKQGEKSQEPEKFYQDAAEYYSQARSVYRQAGSPADEAMEQLEDYMESAEGGF